MSIRNTDEAYGVVARILHWVIGLSIIGMLCLGLYMDALPKDDLNRDALYGFHKAFGLVILFAVGVRVVWFFVNFGKPKPLPTHSKLEVVAAKGAHIVLYLLMIGVPLSGWVMSSAYGFPVDLFGMKFSIVAERDIALARNAGDAHEILAYVMIGVIVLHVAGALRHVIIDKDNTLRRMTCGNCGDRDA